MSEIENRIRDTTHLVQEPTLGQDDAPEIVLCTCGTKPISTHGAAAFMRKCDACYTEINKLLDEELNGESDTEDYAAYADGVIADEEAGKNDEEDLSLESLEGSLILAMSDSSKSCQLQLNGVNETFIYNFDPINHSKARKIFKRKSWDDMFKDLYWYLPFGAIITTTKTIITPCVAQWKASSRSGPIVLYAILETLCNRPRYDAFCMDLEKGEVFVVQSFITKISCLDFNVQFDRSECDKLMMDYLVVNRMFYDPARGLLRTCKKPQQPDTALRKYWSKEKLEAEKKSNSAADVVASSSPMEVQKPKQAAGKTCTAKSTTKACVKTKRCRKNVVIVRSHSESSDPSESEASDDDTPMLPPKRSRAGRAAPANTKPDVAQMEASATTTALPCANGFTDVKRTLPDPLPMPPSVQAQPSVFLNSTQAAVLNSASSASADRFLSHPAAANNSNAIMQLLLSTTYDIALNSARQQELERRERECAARERIYQEQNEKECFLRKAAEALKFMYPGSNF